MKFSKMLGLLALFLLLLGCSEESGQKVEIYEVGNDTKPTQVIEEHEVVEQIETLTMNLERIPIEDAKRNGYEGNPDVIFKMDGDKWFVYYGDRTAVVRKNAGTFFNVPDGEVDQWKNVFR
ncbi:hypothetical protein [Halobacillus salinus]|uniref:Uncharacterized protein n=1 Tax=Halobacillus salinus TaxID=192814 RepID=A0A4Z0H2F7_9BACI|nr:hypothetical protein [Halobacillus salinus]TGB03591.1 hypothetical protein E4663_00875 [Halobacillus salinus]